MSRDSEWIEPEDVGLRLVLFLADDAGVEVLERHLAVGPFAGVVAKGSPARIAALLPVCRAVPCALLALHDLDTAADGVHVAAAEVAQARRRLGDGALVGAEAHASRHEAMVAGEAGADYVTFRAADRDRLVELVEWWSGISVLPCAAAGAIIPDMVEPLARAGAGLLAVGPKVSLAALRELAEAVKAAEAAMRNGR